MTLAAGKIDWAKIRLLGPETEPKIGTPRVMIFHTMVGNLQGTDSMFHQGGFDGTEATWGVGGPWEGAAFDGLLYQWQLAGYQADAQFAGNAYADSVETADGGVPTHPWSSKQLATLIKLTVDWCKGTGNPCQLIAHETDHGLGYHSQWHDWNLDSHQCPGPVRIGQLRTIVIPKARAILHPSQPVAKPPAKPVYWVNPHPKSGSMIHIPVDGVWSKLTVEATQLLTGITHIDGIWGPESRKNLQRGLKVKPDGIIGPITVKAWKSYLKKQGFWPYPWHSIDGVWSKRLTIQHQMCLNAIKF